MKGKTIVLGSVTHAMKSRDILFAKGIKTYLERNSRTKQFGCGYSIRVPQEADRAIEILKAYNIRILAVLDEQED